MPGAGYEGYISYNSPNTYNLAPAVDFQLGREEDDTAHFVIREVGPMRTAVPLDTMWVFGGRDHASTLTNHVHALTTSMPMTLDGVSAASSVDFKYSPTGIEDYTRSTQGWFYEKSVYTDFGSPDRPTPGPSAPAVHARIATPRSRAMCVSMPPAETILLLLSVAYVCSITI